MFERWLPNKLVAWAAGSDEIDTLLDGTSSGSLLLWHPATIAGSVLWLLAPGQSESDG